MKADGTAVFSGMLVAYLYDLAKTLEKQASYCKESVMD
jgi:hypothetical protein